MQKIPVPLVAAIAVVAIVLLGFMVFRSASKSDGGTGDINAISAEIIKNNPKNAPQLPPDTNQPMMGGRGKHGG